MDKISASRFLRIFSYLIDSTIIIFFIGILLVALVSGNIYKINDLSSFSLSATLCVLFLTGLYFFVSHFYFKSTIGKFLLALKIEPQNESINLKWALFKRDLLINILPLLSMLVLYQSQYSELRNYLSYDVRSVHYQTAHSLLAGRFDLFLILFNVVFIINVLFYLFNKKRQSFFDFVSKTLIVNDENSRFSKANPVVVIVVTFFILFTCYLLSLFVILKTMHSNQVDLTSAKIESVELTNYEATCKKTKDLYLCIQVGIQYKVFHGEEGLNKAIELTEPFCGNDAVSCFNLACYYALKNDVDRSVFFINKTYKLRGYVNFNDTDFDLIRSHENFIEAARLIHNSEAEFKAKYQHN
jgi:uncharacterized RDD family membrane protein YckC